MFKKLHVEIYGIRDGVVHMRVTEQSHRGGEFGDAGSNRFSTDAGKRVLMSTGEPMCMSHTLFLRGAHRNKDDEIFTVDASECMNLMETILAYNQHYNKNKLELSDVVYNLKLWRENV